MKTILSILFYCLFVSTASAQTAPPNYQYIPMVVENAHWTVRVNYNQPGGNGILAAHYLLKGDTTIGLYNYKKLYKCPDLVAGLRENLNTHQVYVYPFNNGYNHYHSGLYPVGQDRLLIDFNQDTQTQINVPWLGLGANNTVSFGSNFIDNIERKSITYTNYCAFRTFEGIGFSNGGPVLYCTAGSLSCWVCSNHSFYVSNYNIIPSAQNCSTFVETESKPTQTTDITAFPNPSTGTFYIQNLPPQAQLLLYDALGRSVVFKQKENEINIQNLPTGIYYCTIIIKNEPQQTLKLIKTE